MTRSVILGSTLLSVSLYAAGHPSMLVVDRGLPAASLNESAGRDRANVRFEWNKHNQGFVGDVFTIGSPGELWVVDRISTWAVPGTRSGDVDALGDRFERISLYGGLEGGDTFPVRAVALQPGAQATDGRSVTISPVTYDSGALYEEFGAFLKIWRLDFDALNWTVAGGSRIQFGVMGSGRPVPGSEDAVYRWFNHASASSGHRLRLIKADGTLEAFFDSDGQVWNKSSSLNVQVWAHLRADVSIGAGKVAILGGPSFDINQVDLASLRFGPRGAVPIGTEFADVNHDGHIDLVLRFPPAGAGLEPDRVNACLTGQRIDGVPFAGCDAVQVVGK